MAWSEGPAGLHHESCMGMLGSAACAWVSWEAAGGVAPVCPAVQHPGCVASRQAVQFSWGGAHTGVWCHCRTPGSAKPAAPEAPCQSHMQRRTSDHTRTRTYAHTSLSTHRSTHMGAQVPRHWQTCIHKCRTPPLHATQHPHRAHHTQPAHHTAACACPARTVHLLRHTAACWSWCWCACCAC